MTFDVMNLAIRKSGNKFVVYDKVTHCDKSPRYDDEQHALRYIKYLTGFSGDWRVMQVERMYSDASETSLPEVGIPLSEPQKVKRKYKRRVRRIKK